jgi:hypothetical protein
MRSTSFWPAALTLTFALALGGCTTVGGPHATAQPAPGGESEARGTWQETYGGQVDLQSQKLAMVMELSGRTGDRVDGTVHIPELQLTATGEGRRKQTDGTLDLRLTYPGKCPGTMTIETHRGPDEGTLVGTLEATDCTGSEKGAVRFLRRTANGSGEGAR